MNKERRYQVRQLRKTQTGTEKVFRDLLRSRQLMNYKFRRQHPIGLYVADFCCLEKRVVVELDGRHHLNQQEDDLKRTNVLIEQGYSVNRFWNSQVEDNPEIVVQRILQILENASEGA